MKFTKRTTAIVAALADATGPCAAVKASAASAAECVCIPSMLLYGIRFANAADPD